MKIPFRQGIVQYQSDTNGSPTFLEKSSNGSSIDLITTETPLIVTFAHRSADYLHEDSQTISKAWKNLQSGIDAWLYIDISITSGIRTFGHSTVEPVYGPTASPITDLHWFDTNEMIMKVYNGITWVEVIRVFVAKYSNGSLIQSRTPGSQVGINDTTYAGHLLFDSDNLPLKKNDRRGRGIFYTTETPFTTAASRLVNLKFEGLNHSLLASESLPAFSCISHNGTSNEFKAASFDEIEYPVIGIIEHDAIISEWLAYTPSGYIESDTFNWTSPPGTPLFCGDEGEITTLVPQTGLIQQIGEIVNRNKIKVDIKQPIILEEA